MRASCNDTGHQRAGLTRTQANYSGTDTHPRHPNLHDLMRMTTHLAPPCWLEFQRSLATRMIFGGPRNGLENATNRDVRVRNR